MIEATNSRDALGQGIQYASGSYDTITVYDDPPENEVVLEMSMDSAPLPPVRVDLPPPNPTPSTPPVESTRKNEEEDPEQPPPRPPTPRPSPSTSPVESTSENKKENPDKPSFPLLKWIRASSMLIGAGGTMFFWLMFDVSVGKVVNLGKISFAENGVVICVGVAIVGAVLYRK